MVSPQAGSRGRHQGRRRDASPPVVWVSSQRVRRDCLARSTEGFETWSRNVPRGPALGKRRGRPPPSRATRRHVATPLLSRAAQTHQQGRLIALNGSADYGASIWLFGRAGTRAHGADRSPSRSRTDSDAARRNSPRSCRWRIRRGLGASIICRGCGRRRLVKTFPTV